MARFHLLNQMMADSLQHLRYPFRYYKQKHHHFYRFPGPKRPSYQSRYLTYAKYRHTARSDSTDSWWD